MESDEKFGVIAESPAMREVMRTVRLIAPTEASVAIFGEAGAGKTLVAQELHEKSLRAGHPFIAVECAALPNGSFKTALCGKANESFGGIREVQMGAIDQAEGGTLLLEDVGALDMENQVLLLRILVLKTFERVGSSKCIAANFRIFATNCTDLKDLVTTGTFREDLYYRLCMITIEVSPLRTRAQDILALANAFLRISAAESKRDIQGFDAAALEALANYSWPGNVRQLKNEIQRAVLMCDSDRITLTDLGLNSPSPSSNTVQLPSTKRINFFE